MPQRPNPESMATDLADAIVASAVAAAAAAAAAAAVASAKVKYMFPLTVMFGLGHPSFALDRTLSIHLLRHDGPDKAMRIRFSQTKSPHPHPYDSEYYPSTSSKTTPDAPIAVTFELTSTSVGAIASHLTNIIESAIRGENFDRGDRIRVKFSVGVLQMTPPTWPARAVDNPSIQAITTWITTYSENFEGDLTKDLTRASKLVQSIESVEGTHLALDGLRRGSLID